MSKLLLKNIKTLVQVRESGVDRISGSEMKVLPCIDNAWLAIDNGVIADFGSMDDFPGITDWKDLEVIDVDGKIVMPSYADSHTHIVYAGNREGEFVDRINGLTYDEIFQKGGGILNSAKRLQTSTEDELLEQALVRLNEVILQGTGSVEIKSGYGLSIESEMKILRVIKKIKELNIIPV
jgi:imidazolonepropionase